MRRTCIVNTQHWQQSYYCKFILMIFENGLSYFGPSLVEIGVGSGEKVKTVKSLQMDKRTLEKNDLGTPY